MGRTLCGPYYIATYALTITIAIFFPVENCSNFFLYCFSWVRLCGLFDFCSGSLKPTMTKFKYKLDYLDENQDLGCQLINYKQIIKVKKTKK